MSILYRGATGSWLEGFLGALTAKRVNIFFTKVCGLYLTSLFRLCSSGCGCTQHLKLLKISEDCCYGAAREDREQNQMEFIYNPQGNK